MDPITRKLITARGDVLTETSDVFATYCWNGNDTSAGIHTANAGIDMSKHGGMFWGKLRDGGGNDYNWYLADTVRSPIDGTQGNPNLGEVFDDTPGQKTWTVPAGVTSVSVLCIGGGGGCVLYPQGTTGASGGGGAALAYKNNISVTPGQTITYNVGDGGKGATNNSNPVPNDVISGHYAEAGTPSWFNGTNVNDAVVMGYQGAGAQSYTGGTGGEFSNSTGDGGGSGGTGGSNDGSHSYWAFGGGAAGYSGDGGNGGRWQAGGAYTPGASAGAGGGAGGGLSVDFEIYSEFTLEEAASIELKYAPLIGQLGKELRKNIKSFEFLKGEEGASAQRSADLNYANITFHTGWLDNVVSTRPDGDRTEELMIHESAHLSIDPYVYGQEGWNEAVLLDGNYLSTYAKDNPDSEDVAETFQAYIAVKYFPERISNSLRDTILSVCLNRFKYFDTLNLDLSIYK